MKLLLTTEDGELLANWDIEEEFGDLKKPGTRAALAEAILLEEKHLLERKERGR